MDLPEILLTVGLHLDRPGLAVTVQVCKEWHATFAPILYHRLHLQIDWSIGSSKSDNLPSLAAMKTYWNFVKDITVVLPLPSACNLVNFALSAKRLRIESVFSKDDTMETTLATTAKNLITYIPLLRHLELSRFNGPGVAQCFCRIKEVCSSLTDLQLERTTFELCHMIQLMQGSRRLISLSLLDCEVICPDKNPFRLRGYALFPRIKTLKLWNIEGLTPQELVHWAIHCPRVTSLTLKPLHFAPPGLALAYDASMLEQCCPHLTFFDFTGPVEETVLSAILRKKQRLEELALREHFIRGEIFNALASLFSTLTTLDLIACYSVEGWITKQVLHSCPLLIRFSISKFNVNVIFGDGARVGGIAPILVGSKQGLGGSQGYETGFWACTELQELRIHRLVWSADETRNNLFKRQRAVLHRLRHIVAIFNEDENGHFLRRQAIL